MKAAVIYFLKIFVYMTVAYGGSQLLIYYFFQDSPNLLVPVISGLAFGFTMGLIFTISQIVQVKKFYKGKITPEALSVHQVAHFHSPLSKAQIVAKLKNHYPAKDWKLSEEADLIKLKTSFTAQSFGEKVTIKVNQLQNGLSEIFLESRPNVWYTMADYGKNLENISYLRKLLSA